MKILHIIASVNPTGGGPMEGIKQIAKMLTKLGHAVEVLTLDAPNSPWLKSLEFKCYAVGPGRTRYGYTPTFIPWLKSHYKNYDVIIINGLWMYHSFAAWQVIKNGPVPYYVFTHGMLDPWFKRRYPLRHLRKSLYWPWGEHRVLRDAKAVCFTCEDERILARESFKPYNVVEQVVSYGTSFPEGNPKIQKAAFFRQFPELKDKRVFLFLSRIHEKKGCDMLIEAFSQIADRDPSLHLLFAGPDHYNWTPELQNLAASLGVADRISWSGMISGDVKWGAFRSAEVFVLPSHQENFGIVVAEAMACGTSVLISDKVNIWREIQADGAGLVDKDDLQGSVRLLERWLELSEDEKNELRAKAVETFKSRYEIGIVANSLLNVIHNTATVPEQISPAGQSV